jgi:transposase
MAKVQKTYTREFKEEAVRLVQTSGKPIAQIARELGISDSAIHGWRKELAEHGKDAFPGKGHQTELERVQQERDILKKLWASFRGNTNKIPVYRTTQARIFRLSSCVACLKFRKVVFLPGESVLSVNVNEKMPNLQKRYNRNLAFIVADTAVHACMWSDVIGDEASHASRLPG